MRLFYSRVWESPRFPWPLVISEPGNGVQTTIRATFNRNILLDAMQWNVLGGKGSSTINDLAEAAGKGKHIVLIRNLHILYEVSNETPWYKTVTSEIHNLLSGTLADCLSQAQIDNITRNLFFIGTGDWGTESPLDLEEIHTFLQKFHSTPLHLGKPTQEEWEEAIKAELPNAKQEVVKAAAHAKWKQDMNFSKMGEVISECLLDTPIPELSELIKSQHKEDPAISNGAPAGDTSKFIRNRVRLLLCKLYGETSAEEIRNSLTKSLKHLETGEGITNSTKELSKLSSKLTKGELKELPEGVRAYFIRQLDTARAIIAQGAIDC